MNKEYNYVPAYYSVKNNEIFGKLPLFYYKISADPHKSYYYKSYVNSADGIEKMTDQDIKYVFDSLRDKVQGEFKLLLYAIEARYKQEKLSQNVNSATMLRFAKAPVVPTPAQVVTRHNTDNQERRKALQRDKQLAKFSTIAPVVLKDNEGQETALCAKMNDEYFYVSLDESKPAFYKVGLSKAEVMDVYEVGDLWEFASRSQKSEHIASNLALTYKKFVQAKLPKPTKTANEVYYSKVRIALAKGLQAFSPIERKLCENVKKRQR